MVAGSPRAFAPRVRLERASLKRFSASFDHGWFVLLAFPIYAPYHLIATRRWRGAAIALGMGVLFVLPWIAQVIVYCCS
jgi:hypothetical protein